jgi:hypothetical protein
MLINQSETTSWKSGIGKDHQEGVREGYFSLLLFDYHGEYTGTLGSIYAPEDNAHAEARIVFDPHRLEDLLEARLHLHGLSYDHPAREVLAPLMTQIAKLVFGERIYDAIVAENGEDAIPGGYHWLIEGNREGLIRIFEQLLKALSNLDPARVEYGSYGTPSGDDDTYDYWPNTMDMLWAFALDLVNITDSDEWTQKVQTLAITVARLKFSDDPSDCEWGRTWLPENWAEGLAKT